MTRDDILRLAGEAGLVRNVYLEFSVDRLERFANLIALAEREAFALWVTAQGGSKLSSKAEHVQDEGFKEWWQNNLDGCPDYQKFVAQDAWEAAIAFEREACAKLADAEADEWPGNSDGLYASRNIAAAILARGEQ